MRRSAPLELSGVELHEVVHACRCLAGELAHGVRHAVVAPLLVQLGHGREMADDMLGKPCLPEGLRSTPGAGRRDIGCALPSASEKTRA